MNADRVLHLGQSAFGVSWKPTELISAPGRLELLGNHIDYNGGLVLAGAIDRTVSFGVSECDTSGIRLVTELEPGLIIELDSDALHDWRKDSGVATPADYLRGVIASLHARQLPVATGLCVAIAGNIPIGFGMSSSAALCVDAVFALSRQAVEDRDVVLIAQEAEHRAGSPVGAMDQSASVAGEVILFNGANVSWNALQPDLGSLVFAVANSGVHHALSESSYPKRVAESQTALRLINEHLHSGYPNLAAVPFALLQDIEGAPWLPQTLRHRVRHVLTESARVKRGVEAVQNSAWHAFGELMRESGKSSASDYEISAPEVEELVDLLNSHEGVLGARMMGGGEGGPALALIEADAVEDIRAMLDATFFRNRSLTDPFQVCSFGPGAHRETPRF